MKPIEMVLSKLERVRPAGDRKYMARCPAHDDGTASLSITSGKHGCALLNCHAGCSVASIVEAVGLTMRDLFETKARPKKAASNSQPNGGVTLAQLAMAKGLPIQTLHAAGWRDATYAGKPAVEIPYFHRDGSKARAQFRVSLAGDRFRWAAKGKGEICAYEPDLGARAKELAFLIVVEGATDAIAGMIARMPMLGLPGANQTAKITAAHVEGITRVLYCREPDAGGDSLANSLPRRLHELGYGGQLCEVRLEGAKDICELHAKDPARFVERLEAAIKAAAPIDVEAAVKAAAPETDWKADLLVNDKGKVKPCLANTMHVIARHPEWTGVLARDAFREHIVKLSPPPVREQDGLSTPGEWTSEDSARTATWLASEVGFEPTLTHVETAVTTFAQNKIVHEVRDYLGSLEWDGVPRLDTMLHRYFGAADTEYTRAVGARWMISAVARVMQPGCQADCVLVVEGEQGDGKSTGFEALFGKPYFSDTPPNIGDKDAYQSLRGKWCIEFGELDAIKGKEAAKVKNFVSARSDNYRSSYGRRNCDHLRQIVFAASTNERHYLVDQTGNRRFWPVRCLGRVDVKGLGLERDQFWAEACVRYERGEPWHVDTPELRELCEQAQREREVEDAWLEPVNTYLASLVDKSVTTFDVLGGALKLEKVAMTPAATTRVGQILRKLGWVPRQIRDGAVRSRVYRPAESRPSQQAGREEWDGDPLDNEAQSQQSHPSHHHSTCTQETSGNVAEDAPPIASTKSGFEDGLGVTDDSAADEADGDLDLGAADEPGPETSDSSRGAAQ